MTGRRNILKLKDFCLLFGIQFLQYFVVTLNFRAVASGLYWWTFVSDVAAATNAYLLIKSVSESKGGLPFVGYVAGGAFGGLVAIYSTKWLASHGGF